jgi:hypothetical protein
MLRRLRSLVGARQSERQGGRSTWTMLGHQVWRSIFGDLAWTWCFIISSQNFFELGRTGHCRDTAIVRSHPSMGSPLALFAYLPWYPRQGVGTWRGGDRRQRWRLQRHRRIYSDEGLFRPLCRGQFAVCGSGVYLTSVLSPDVRVSQAVLTLLISSHPKGPCDMCFAACEHAPFMVRDVGENGRYYGPCRSCMIAEIHCSLEGYWPKPE